MEEDYGEELEDMDNMEKMFEKSLTNSNVSAGGIRASDQKKMSVKLRMSSTKQTSMRASEKVLKLKSFNMNTIQKKSTGFVDLDEKKQ